MPDFLLHCEPDGSSAGFEVGKSCRRGISLEELHLHLRRRQIVFGIDELALQSITSGAKNGERVVVASCKPAEKGTPGRLEWLIDRSKIGKPRVLEDGKVNLRDLQFDINVHKGERLVRCIPPQHGKPGMSIFGTVLSAPPVESATITLGDGTERDAENSEFIVASNDGAVIFNGTTVEVHNRKVITGDVDYGTGNVSFSGDLKIDGSIRSGFSVSATGEILIAGSVEDAAIKSGGSVIIQGGATGSGNGAIVCGGSLRVHHATQFRISAEHDVVIQEDALHSTILSEGNVRARVIIGGSVTAFSITAETVGSNAEARTVLDVTRIAQLLRERYNLLKQFGAIVAQRTESYQEMYCLVRDGMDEQGHLPLNHRQTLESLKQNTLQSVEAAAKVQQRIEKIDELEKTRQEDASIRIGHIYPNTIIRIGNEERLIRESQNNFFVQSASG